MQSINRILVPLSVIFLGVVSAQDPKPPTVQQLIFSIAIAPVEGAAETEIEFSDIDLAQASTAEQLAGARTKSVRTKEKIYREYLAPEIKFFRLRSIHITGVRGAYSVTRPVADFMRKAFREPKLPIVQQGQTEYLLGSRIELPIQPNLVTKYKLNDGEFLEYREPLVFDKPATYKMQVNIENQQQDVVFTKNYVFKVELNPPTTRAVISDPVHSRDGILLGKESSLVFLAEDNESGVAQTFYRIIPLAKDVDAIPFSVYGARLKYSDVAPSGSLAILQYYSVDKAGNKEAIKTELLRSE
ncbi:MAG: hypothetical protein JSR44_00290 [Spirochaetes bacterium]|nr:hypothetical protein [Spirochaetota bacterium]